MCRVAVSRRSWAGYHAASGVLCELAHLAIIRSGQSGNLLGRVKAGVKVKPFYEAFYFLRIGRGLVAEFEVELGCHGRVGCGFNPIQQAKALLP